MNDTEEEMSSHPCGGNASCLKDSETLPMEMAPREDYCDNNTFENDSGNDSGNDSDTTVPKVALGASTNSNRPVEMMETSATENSASQQHPHIFEQPQGHTAPEALIPFEEGEEGFDINCMEYADTIRALTQYGFVLVSTFLGPQKRSFMSTLRYQFEQEGYQVRVKEAVSDWDWLGDYEEKSLVLVDAAFGLVRLDKELYLNFIENGVRNISSHSHKIVFFLFPHILRELQTCDTGSPTQRLDHLSVVSLGHDPRLSVKEYRAFFVRLLSEPDHRLLIRTVLCLTMQNQSFVRHRGHVDTYFHSHDLEQYGKGPVQEFFNLLKGFLLDEHKDHFVNRHVYDAAGLALDQIFSNTLTLRLCDVKFLVQNMKIGSSAKGFSVILEEPDKSYLLMQRAHEAIVTGQVPEICQHPNLHDPDFLQEFEAFCRKEGQLCAVISAVDSQHGLPLLYWSVWAQSPCLTDWCLQLMKDQYTDGDLLSHFLLSTAFLVALLRNCGHRDLSGLVTHLRDQLLDFPATAHTTLTLPLPCVDSRHTDSVQNLCDKVTEHLKRSDLFYLGDPAVPIPFQLLNVTLAGDTIYLALPCQQPYMAVRALGDSEVDEADSEGNSLLHVAAHASQVQGVRMAVHSGACLLLKNKTGQTAPQLAARRRGEHGDLGAPCPETWTRLQAACAAGDIATVKELLCVSLTVYDKGPDGMTPLHLACLEGHAGIASLLVDLNAPLNCVNDSTQTPLYVACQRRHLDMVRLLAERACDVNLVDSGEMETADVLPQPGADISVHHLPTSAPLTTAFQRNTAYPDTETDKHITPLLVACHKGHKDIMKLLVNCGADINVKDSTGNSPLLVVCHKGHTDIVKLLLDCGADINVKDSTGNSPLLVVCHKGHTDIVKLLLDCGADINVKDSTGNSPLLVVCDKGHTDIVKLLLDWGAEINVKDSTGNSPLLVVCDKGHTDIVKLLVDCGADINVKGSTGNSPLLVVCHKGHTDIVKLLLDCGADINVKDSTGNSPLLVACDKDHTDIVKLLLDCGADINVQDSSGNSPLLVVCDKGHTDIVKLLVNYEAYVNVKNSASDTPLLVACGKGHTDIVQLLLDSRADLNMKDSTDSSPLLVACDKGHTDIVQLLLNYGAYVNVKESTGDTPLLVACSKGYTDIVQLLLNCGAYVNVKNCTSDTPLVVACSKGYTDIVQLLLNDMADVNVKTHAGNTPLLVACREGHTDIVQLLLNNKAGENMKNDTGDTPLLVARDKGHTDIVELLLNKASVI